MLSTIRFEIVNPRPVPPNLRVELPSACSNSQENTRLVLQRDADAGVAHGDGNHVRLRGRLDDDGDAALLGELDRVAGEIEQNLAQPRGVADHARGQALVDIAADLQPFSCARGAEQLDDFLDKGCERRTAAPRDRAGRLRSWKNRAPPRSATAASRPRSSRPSDRSSAPASARVSPRRSAMPRMPFSGVRISCETIGRNRDLARLAASAWSRAIASARSVSTRSVTSRPTLCISLGPSGAHRHFAPGDPAGAIGRRDFLVIDARAVGQYCGFALFQHRQREGAGNKVFAAAAGKRAISVVNVTDGAIGVAPHDHVVLRLEKTLRCAPGLREFPSSGQLPRRDASPTRATPPSSVGCARSGCPWRHRRRRTVTQRRWRTYMGRSGRGRCRPGQEAEGDRKRHRRNGDGANDEREQAAAENGGFSKMCARAHCRFPAWYCRAAAADFRAIPPTGRLRLAFLNGA